MALRPSPFGHTRCDDPNDLDYRIISSEHFETSSPLGPQARQPTMAMLDDSLEMRVQYSLEDFLVKQWADPMQSQT
ncbi:BQ2448_5394 [Microbotryum intermedium]|uniref:BQ2448_5394 protein n=1 Tax=Microbotryum intermedium TaxID=269621 RepID=A0A238F6Z5_9BASI|nr:BQ2448_5394 [Microbotryum intermedium]